MGTTAVIDDPSPRVSNSEFARRVGCHFTAASRYRNGNRLPGVIVLNAIEREFKIPRAELLAAWRAGKAEFAKLLQERVFGDIDEFTHPNHDPGLD
jgi:transcriptional regulator with XRE-family HTH domain